MKWLLSLLVLVLFSSCDKHDVIEQSYKIYWQDDNICIVMPHPTLGIAGRNQIDWRGVDLSDVVNNVFSELQSTKESGEVFIWVRFENPQTDKYGNETMGYNDYPIAIIPISEAQKFKSGKYLDGEYHLIDGIMKAAFGFKNI